jgi:hypothetical protein
MTDSHVPHARAFDLPGWPCPPRVRDIPHHENSWGWVPMYTDVNTTLSVAQDDLGFLWVNGDIIPQFMTPDARGDQGNPGALVFWVPSGIGLWVHPKSLGFLPSISRLDEGGRNEWLPVNETPAQWPPFITPPA